MAIAGCSSIALAGLLIPGAGPATAVDPNVVDTGFGLIEFPADDPFGGDLSVSAKPRQNTASGGTPSTVVVNGVAWNVAAFSSNGNFTLDQTTDLQYMVLAGGGGGGGTGGSIDDQGSGGGGGAGGLLNNLATTSGYPPVQAGLGVSANSGTYSLTVGNGGAGGVATARGSNGTASALSGGNLTTVTATGGGGGGSGGLTVNSGLTGGSGGGGGRAGRGSRTNPPIQGGLGGIGYFGVIDPPDPFYDSLTSAGAGGGGASQSTGSAGGTKDVFDALDNPYTVGVGGPGGKGFVTDSFGGTETFGGGGGGGVGKGTLAPWSDAGGGGAGGGGAGGFTGNGGLGTPGYGAGGGGAGTGWIQGGGNDAIAKNGGLGGSGLVRVRFRKFPDNPSAPPVTTLSGNTLSWTAPEYQPSAAGPLKYSYVAYRVKGTSTWSIYARTISTPFRSITLQPTKLACGTSNSANWNCYLMLGDPMSTGVIYEVVAFETSATLIGQMHLSLGIKEYTP